MTEKERKYYDRIKNELMGQKISGVYYQEINWETDDSEFWSFSADIHSVDMSVIFRLENGKLIQILWDSEFYSYGVGFAVIDKLDEEKEGFKILNVSKSENWKKLIGEKISGIGVLWDISSGITIEYKDNQVINCKNAVIKLPQTWELTFGKNKVWIATFEITEDESDNYYWADHLTILFSNEAQKKYKLSENVSSKHYIA
ncbi:hypothetical protein [uncultured Psychroserpens sp.]|uniref:hypothetical protein n=1 Tax=uncultured Psychroserpens sp. TaxID=255436 RepID=UPI002634B49E|nr:hypothetical protein [uncultured Psychroserpens sp.]